MLELIFIILAASLVNNIVVEHLLGLAPLLPVSARTKIARDFSVAVLCVMTVTAPVIYLLDVVVLARLQTQAFHYLLLLLAVVAVIQSTGLLMKQVLPQLADRVERFRPLLMMNCVVLAAALLKLETRPGLPGALVTGLGTGCGFALIQIMFAEINNRLVVLDLPAPFRGMSVQLVTLGIISMAFLGFTGLARG